MRCATSCFAIGRVAQIRDVMSVFYDQCQPGDVIAAGIVGDDLYPDELNTSRPEGVITRVMSTAAGDRADAIRVQFPDGKRTFALSSLDAHGVWEFTPASFDGVLARTVERAEIEYRGMNADPAGEQAYAQPDAQPDAQAEEAPVYRGTVNTLAEEVARLTQGMERMQADEGKFRSVMVETLAKMARGRASCCAPPSCSHSRPSRACSSSTRSTG